MSVLMLLIVSFFAVAQGLAQPHNPYDLPNYAFIQYDKNTFHFPVEEEGFDPFFQKMDSIMIRGAGKINIVHIGGSHIQADIYTHLLRQRLQQFAMGMNGGRGMVFPFDIAQTNNPWNYNVQYDGTWDRCRNIDRDLACPLGLTGMAVFTDDTSAWFSLNLDADSTEDYGFNRIKLFYNTRSSAFKPFLKDSLLVKRRNVNHALGYEELFLDTTLHQAEIRLSPGSAGIDPFTLYGVYFEEAGSGLVYNAVGVNGSKLGSFLKCEYLGNHLQALETDMVIISMGTNDAYKRRFNAQAYKSEYKALLNRIREYVPDAAILLTVPNDSYLYRRYANPHTSDMQEIIYELAAEHHCGVWDFYRIMGGLNSSQKWYLTDMMRPDRIHFNKAGYLLKGDLLFNAFSKAYDGYLEGKSNPVQIDVFTGQEADDTGTNKFH